MIKRFWKFQSFFDIPVATLGCAVLTDPEWSRTWRTGAALELLSEYLPHKGRSQERVRWVLFQISALQSPKVLPNTIPLLRSYQRRGKQILWPILALCNWLPTQEKVDFYFWKKILFLIKKQCVFFKNKTFREEFWESLGKVSLREKLSLCMNLVCMLFLLFVFIGNWTW